MTCSPGTPAARRPSTARTVSPRPWPARRAAWPPAAAGGRAAAIPSFRLYLKREDLAHTGAHKINNALGQALLTRRLGKTRVIAETGAGQHGVATATACALLGLPCVVFMGEEDIRRQAPNVLRMRALGAEVRSVTSGTATLKDAVNEAMRDWVTNVETTHYVLGSAMGPHPYPTIVRDLQRRIGDEAAAQLYAVEGRLPDLALACVGGGSNAIGLLSRFIGEPSVRLAVAEAAGDGVATGRHAAAIAGGTPGILHGSRSLMLQDRDGQVVEAHSASAGLDYPGVGPQLAALAEGGRLEVGTATDREAVAAMRTVTRTEGILPALETAHAVAALPKLLAGVEGSGAAAPGRCADPARVLRARRQGPCGAGAVLGRRTLGGRGVTAAAAGAARAHTNDTAGARRIAGAFAQARAEGRAALIPYVVAGYPDADTSFAGRLRGHRRRRGPARGRACRTRIRSRTAPRSSARPRARSPPGRPSTARWRSSRASPPPGRRCRSSPWATRTSSSAAATGATGPGAGEGRGRRRHRRGPHPGRGRAVRGGRGRGGDRGRLPRRADVLAGPPGRRRRPQRRVPLLRLAGRRHRRPDVAAAPRSRSSFATSPPSRRSRSPSASACRGPPTSGRSRRPARTA